MISNETMEKYWWKYREEGVGKGLSLQTFCSLNNIPYNAFEKYLKLRRHFSEIHQVQVTDIPATRPDDEAAKESEVQRATLQDQAKPQNGRLRIMVDIRMTNGINIRQKNLDYSGLKVLVEKLEVLC